MTRSPQYKPDLALMEIQPSSFRPGRWFRHLFTGIDSVAQGLRIARAHPSMRGRMFIEDLNTPARRLPEPVPDDWFEAEHFQGDHARA